MLEIGKNKYYIASSLLNAKNVLLFKELLEKIIPNLELTYNWAEHGPAGDQGEKFLSDISEKELQGVLSSDYVFVLMPGGRGTHVELGAALATNKKIFINFETKEEVTNKTCAFYWNEKVKRVNLSLEDFVKLIKEKLNDE